MDSQDNNSSTHIIGNCLSCNGLVRVPVNAPSDIEVRCPHCLESFPLAEMLADLIPELELIIPGKEEVVPRVDQVLPPIAEDGDRQKFIVPNALSKGARRRSKRSQKSRRSSEVSVSKADDFALPDSEQGSDENTKAVENPVSNLSFQDVNDDSWSIPSLDRDRERARDKRSKSESSRSRNSGSSSRRPSSRGKKKKGPNPTVEFVKVALGGTLAIPIAYMLVLGVFQQDPLGFAPTFEKVLPFVVPEKLKSVDTETLKAAPASNIETPEDEDRVIDLEIDPLSLLELDPTEVDGIKE